VPRGLVLALAVALAATSATVARADGDPASDVLPINQVYFPLTAPSAGAQSALKNAVDAVYADGQRVKVAVIATKNDLGAIPSLMNKPDDYAKFLGQELMAFYVGPLLIAMPNGWGIWDGGRSVSAETDVLKGIDVNGSSVDDLVRSTAAAVHALGAAGALKSADIRAPWVYPQPLTVHPGKTAVVVYRVLDDSNHASVAITIAAGAKRLAKLGVPLEVAGYPAPHAVRWRVPKTIAKKSLQLCMTATDPSGNTSKPNCVPFKVAR
jgi:hypothetical protein